MVDWPTVLKMAMFFYILDTIEFDENFDLSVSSHNIEGQEHFWSSWFPVTGYKHAMFCSLCLKLIFCFLLLFYIYKLQFILYNLFSNHIFLFFFLFSSFVLGILKKINSLISINFAFKNECLNVTKNKSILYSTEVPLFHRIMEELPPQKHSAGYGKTQRA